MARTKGAKNLTTEQKLERSRADLEELRAKMASRRVTLSRLKKQLTDEQNEQDAQFDE